MVLYVARSTKGVLRLSSNERASIILPDEIKDVLIGILLGDAHISRRSLTANSRLTYTQTAESHKEYFELVYSLFQPFCVKDYTIQNKIFIDNRSAKTYKALSFTSMQLPCFNVFREMFYISSVKTVPENIYDLLKPRSLAFWIMDDGSRQGDGLHISVYGFTNSDLDKLMFTLQDKYNLKCSIHLNKDNKPRIYIFKESMDNLKNLTKEYFVQEMLYKLGI